MRENIQFYYFRWNFLVYGCPCFDLISLFKGGKGDSIPASTDCDQYEIEPFLCNSEFQVPKKKRMVDLD